MIVQKPTVVVVKSSPCPRPGTDVLIASAVAAIAAYELVEHRAAGAVNNELNIFNQISSIEVPIERYRWQCSVAGRCARARRTAGRYGNPRARFLGPLLRITACKRIFVVDIGKHKNPSGNQNPAERDRQWQLIAVVSCQPMDSPPQKNTFLLQEESEKRTKIFTQNRHVSQSAPAQ